MVVTKNRFLSQLDDFKKEKDTEKEDIYKKNRFLKQIKKPTVEEELPKPIKLIEKGKKEGKDLLQRVPRYGMQTAIGTALGRLLFSSAAPGLFLGSAALPGAIEGGIQEEEEFQRNLPPRIKEALDLPEFDPEIARKSAKGHYEKLVGKRGGIDRLTQLPFEAAGIDTEPETQGEEFIRSASEIVTGFGGPKAFSELIFSQLPQGVKSFFKNGSEELLKKLIGQEPLPESVYETADKILKEAQTLEIGQSPKELSGRVSAGGKKIDVELPQNVKGELTQRIIDPEERQIRSKVGDQISPHKFTSEFEGGKNQIEKIQEVAKERKSVVNQAYDTAEEAYKNVSDIHPELVSRLQESKDKILGGREVKLLNTAEKNVVDSIDNLISTLVDENGNYIEQPVSSLIKTAKSWSSKLSHEEIFGDVKRFLSKLIPSLNEEALKAVVESGGDPSLLREADKIYSEWAKKFANDEISPYLVKNIRNPEAIFRKSISDEGTFRAVNEALEGTAYEDAIKGSTSREIVEERLDPYLRNLEKVGSPQYEKAIDNLSPLIGKDPARKVDNELRTLQQQFLSARKKPFKAERGPIGKGPLPSPFQASAKKVSQFLDKEPEDIIKMGQSRSGLKNLKKILDKSPKGKSLFNQFKRQKVRDILTKNKITKKMKGKDLYEVLRNRDNYEILSELMGSEETQGALEAAKKLAEKKISPEALTKIGSTALTIKFYKLLVDLLP